MANTKNAVVWSDFKAIDKTLLRPDISVEESQQLYGQWVQFGNYDKDLAESATDKYGALAEISIAVANLFEHPEGKLILDIGAGTGLTAKEMQSLGYKKIDALEPNQAFADMIRGMKIYGKVYQEFIGGGKRLNIPDDTYDAIVTSGAFAPGHIPCDALLEMIRIVKPGGYIVNCMREEYFVTVPEYRNRLQPLMEQLVKEGKWKKIQWKVYPNHYGDKTGVSMIFQVC